MSRQSTNIRKSNEMLNFNGEYLRFFPSIGLKITGSCRMKCLFCCEPNRHQMIYHIDNFIKITEILKELGTRRLCFTGGEPLLYPNIVQLLKHTKLLGFNNLLLTCDGTQLIKKHEELSPYIDAVRFSIHGLESLHDNIVQCDGAFLEMERALDLLTQKKITCFVTTVVSSINLSSVPDIAKWCIQKKVKTYFLFGLMRSGLGDEFLNTVGEIKKGELSNLADSLHNIYSCEQLEVIYYNYKNNAECVLIYGDGRVLVDPYPAQPNYQLEIGNILSDSSATILKRFNEDPENGEGHSEHLKRYYKEVKK